MIVIVCVDDKNGMMFNHRRQSRDRALIGHIIDMVGTEKLWIGSYTKKLFEETVPEHLVVDENCLNRAENGDFCFVEDKDISGYMECIEKLILFKWNRHYPADMFLTVDTGLLTLVETEEFTGHSHEKITKEIYVK